MNNPKLSEQKGILSFCVIVVLMNLNLCGKPFNIFFLSTTIWCHGCQVKAVEYYSLEMADELVRPH